MSDNKIKILVVDDSDVILHALRNFFKDYQFDVITCHDGLEGVQKASEELPSLIILDLMMPNLDGVKMLRVIKVIEKVKEIPVIVISGNTNKRNVIAAIEAGAETVLSKPLKKDVLKKAITEILGNEFFVKAKEKKIREENEKEFQKELRQFFLNSFHIKRELIEKSLSTKDLRGLRHVFHEIKGSGSTIGYKILTKIGSEVEEMIDEEFDDWKYYHGKCDEVFDIVKQMEQEEQNTEL